MDSPWCHLFGRISVLPKYVIGEEDQLEWVTACKYPESARTPVRRTRRNNLIFWCEFPDWLTRFILRTAKNNNSRERGF